MKFVNENDSQVVVRTRSFICASSVLFQVEYKPNRWTTVFRIDHNGYAYSDTKNKNTLRNMGIIFQNTNTEQVY